MQRPFATMFFEGIGAGDYLRTAAGIPIAALLLRLIVLAVALGPRHFSPGKELAKNTIAVVRYSPERPMKSVKVYAPAFLDIALDLHFRFVTMKPMVCE